MSAHKQSGFTIIEVIIFLAVTALMITVALIGTGTQISTTRFTDSMRSFETFMQGQYDETFNGVNSRTGTEVCESGMVDGTGGNSLGQSKNCLLLGKYVYVTPGSPEIKVHYVVGKEVDTAASDAEAIKLSAPHIVQGFAVSTYEIPWGAQVYGARNANDNNGNPKPINSIAILRSPVSSSIYTYSFLLPGGPTAGDGDLSDYVSAAATANRQTNICLKSADISPTMGAVTLTRNARGQDAINTRIDIDADDAVQLTNLCEGA